MAKVAGDQRPDSERSAAGCIAYIPRSQPDCVLWTVAPNLLSRLIGLAQRDVDLAAIREPSRRSFLTIAAVRRRDALEVIPKRLSAPGLLGSGLYASRTPPMPRRVVPEEYHEAPGSARGDTKYRR